MKGYKGYFIDLDGTIYKGKDRIPAAARFIKRLQDNNKVVLFVTNNSTRTPEFVARNLKINHKISVSAANVYTSALATADYMDQIVNGERSVYVIGEDGLKKALLDKGFILTDNRPAYVVVGLDSHVTYEKFETAVLNIRSGAKFIGTNADSNLPNEKGMVPGAGSLVELVRYATQTKPVMIGKPEKIIMEMARAKSDLKKDEVIMVGDNYNTDILAGINDGIDTLIVYTGLSKKSEVANEEIPPTYEVNSLDDWKIE